jgi:hypothetical protein
LEQLRSIVPFFKTFANRGFDLLDKLTDQVFQDLKKDFQSSGLKNGSQLMLREPGKMQREQTRLEQ